MQLEISELRFVQEALRESEKRFRNITVSMVFWIWEIDENGIYTYCSERIKDILGYSPEEIEGKKMIDLMLPTNAENVGKTFLAAAADSKTVNDIENWNIHKNGRQICLLTSGIPIIDSYGVFKGYRGVHKDITEQKVAEKALQKSEEKHRNLFENADIGMYRLGLPDSIILDVNKKFAEIFEYERDRMLAEPTTFQWTDEKVWNGMMRQLEKTHKISNFEILVTTTKHVQKICLFSAQLYPENGYIEGSVIDITDRKKAEETVKAALFEKEILLKEIHHRVKNNLQVVSSLLDLQSEKISDMNALQSFRESQHRVKTMALIHEKLYQSEGLAKIDFSEYIIS